MSETENTYAPIHTVKLEGMLARESFPEPESKNEEDIPLYILDLAQTALAGEVRERGVKNITPEKITEFLRQRGFNAAANRGVALRADGKVLVYSETDPTQVWQDFTNAELPQEAAQALTLSKLKAYRTKAKAGNVSAKDIADALDTVIGTMLKAYGQE
jgi:hypothetical protein